MRNGLSLQNLRTPRACVGMWEEKEEPWMEPGGGGGWGEAGQGQGLGISRTRRDPHHWHHSAPAADSSGKGRGWEQGESTGEVLRAGGAVGEHTEP